MFLEDLDRLLASEDELKTTYQDIPQPRNFSLEHLRLWFEQFRVGGQYVNERFGMLAKTFLVVNSVETAKDYFIDHLGYVIDPGVDTIVVTNGFLRRNCEAIAERRFITTPHISPLAVRATDASLLLGVEEAHHSYFWNSGQGRLTPFQGDYFRDPTEIAAGVVVRQALTHFGLKVVRPKTPHPQMATLMAAS